MVYKNKKGFTLVEMLTTITILGIVTLIALPTIRTLKENYNNGKYDMYKNSLESAAKLYVDSYSKDLFGNQENGCVDLIFKEGEKFFESRLIEDIEIKDVTCANQETFVRVRKNGAVYEYKSSVVCKDKDGNELYRNNKELESDASCDNDVSSTNIIINITGSEGVRQTHNAQIDLQDAQGFSGRQELTYEWIGKQDVISWKDVNNKRRLVSNTINSPTGINGDYYLEIKSYKINNKLGNSTVDAEKSVLRKKFIFDNMAPTVKLQIKTKDTSNKINTGLTDVVVDAEDAHNITQVCVTTENDSKRCSWKNVSKNNKVNYVTNYGSDSNTGKGTVYSLYAFAKDEAGNIGKSSKVTYTVSKDSTPPRVNLKISSKDSTYNTAVVNLKADAEDDTSNITKICITYVNDVNDCTKWNRWIKNPNKTKTFSYSKSDGDSEMIGTGLTYTFYAFAQDEYGNTGSTKATYKIYTNCTSTTHIDCRGYREVGSRPCTVSHGNGWGKKGAICKIKDDKTQAVCGETLRTCPCDSWCDRDGRTNIPWNEFNANDRKHWEGYGGTCKRPFCTGGVLCEANACWDASYY